MQDTEFIIEETNHFKETYPLHMASVLVDINTAPACEIRILNPFQTSWSVQNDTIVGQAEKIDHIKGTVVEKEHSDEKGNFISVRKVTIKQDEPTITRDTEMNTKASVEVPSHLQSMYENACTNRSHEEKLEIAKLLGRFKNSFSKDDLDLGVTHLTEHSINTGNAVPRLVLFKELWNNITRIAVGNLSYLYR
ncbi:hypothetical protein DPMN_114907 [Dreissena polymorpha]|uniref:Uncharacterized protein n=1 Tax=Dreissena polymorpha TaxID=45954 RepID=A0A9D4KL34_DREPO|nr:hypothetical protein DPMN_114907 [Dreissena polymorpha]